MNRTYKVAEKYATFPSACLGELSDGLDRLEDPGLVVGVHDAHDGRPRGHCRGHRVQVHLETETDAMVLIGWKTPVSLLECMMLTMAVRADTAAAIASRSTWIRRPMRWKAQGVEEIF